MKTKALNVLICLGLTLGISVGALAKDERMESKINELVVVMDMDSMVETMYSQMEAMMNGMSEQMGVQPSEQPIVDKFYAQLIRVVKEDMGWERMEPLIVDIYKRNFTETEIEDMLAFYKTESGQSLLKKMPIVMQESMQVSQTLAQGAVPKLQEIGQQFQAELQKARNQ